MTHIDPIEVVKEKTHDASVDVPSEKQTNAATDSLQALKADTMPKVEKRKALNEKLAILRQQTEEKKKEMREIDKKLTVAEEEQRSALLQKKEQLVADIQTIEHLRSEALTLQRELQDGMVDQAIDMTGRAIDYAKENPVNALKITAVTALGVYLAYKTTKVVVGAVLHPIRTVQTVAGWFTHHIDTAVNDGKEAAKGNPGNLAKKILAGGIIGIASLLGISWLMKHGLKDLAGVLKDAQAFMDGTKSMKDSAVVQGKKLLEEGKEAFEKKSTDLRHELQPWTQYDISKEDYEKADELCYKSGVENSREEIRSKIFKLEPGASSPAYEKFMADMEQKYEVRSEKGTTYRRANVAEKNWEANGKSALLSIEQWIENNATLVLAGTYLAYQMGVLQAIIRGTLSIGEKALAIAKALTKFGIASAKKHKFISLLLLVGGALGGFTAYKKLKETFLPEDIKSLIKVGAHKDGEIVLGAPSDGSLNTFISDVRTHATAIGGAIDDFGTWVKDQSMEFLSGLKESIPDAIGLTSEEIIFHRNMGCMDNLEQELIKQKANVPSDIRAVEEKKDEKYAHALTCLDQYRQEFTLENCTEVNNDPKTKEALDDLIDALKAVGITVSIKDGIMKWKKDGEKEEYDLSIDPSIDGKKKREELSRTLWHGQGDIDVFVASALEDLRKQYQDGKMKLEKLTGKDWKGIAAVAGPFVFFFDVNPLTGFVDLANVKNYSYAHIDAIRQLYSIGTEGFTQENMNAMGQTIATIAGGGMCLAVTGEVLNAVKRVTIGGGPILTGIKSRMIMNATPFLGPARMIREGLYTARDTRNVWRLGAEGRRFNTLCAHAGVRQEWIEIIEAGSPKNMRWLAKWHLKIADWKSLSDADLQRALRELAREKFKHATVTRMGDFDTFWKGRHIGEGWYDVIAEKITGKQPPAKLGAEASSAVRGADMASGVAKSLRTMDPWALGQMNMRLQTFGNVPPKVTEALKNVGSLEQKLVDAIDSSDDFARAMLTHMSAVDDPASVLKAMNSIAGKVDDVTMLTKIYSNEKAIAQVITKIHSGTDVAGALSKTAKIIKGLQVAGVVADVFTIYIATCEMIDAEAKIDALKARGGNDKLQSAYREQQAINVAQIGVASVGTVSGTIVLAGVGGTVGAVAGPVALATLPISAVLGMAYQGNKWSQAKSRTTKDWRAEYDPATMATDLRSYGYFTKGAGHLWDFGFDDWRWTYKFSGLGPYVHLYEWLSGESDKQFKQLVTDIRSTNETKIRTLVEDTTMISIQTDEAGNPRTPTPEEAKALEALYDAKVQYILGESKSMLTPISSGADVYVLLRNAEIIGQIAYKKALGGEMPSTLTDTSKSPDERITAYKNLEKSEAVQSIITAGVITKNLSPDAPSFETAVGYNIDAYLMKHVQPMIVRFGTECQEENFVDWGLDGEAPGVLHAHTMTKLQEKLTSEKKAITAMLSSKLASMGDQALSKADQEQLHKDLARALDDAVLQVKEALLNQRPKQMWDAMSEEDKVKARTLIATAQKQAEEAKKKQEREQPTQAA